MARAACLILLVFAFLLTASTTVLLFGADRETQYDLGSDLELISPPTPPTARSEFIRQAFARRRERIRKPQYLTDAHLIQDALDHAASAPPRTAAPEIAFLFLVRGEMSFEPIWRHFFANHDGKYSLYVHAAPGYAFPNTSLFAGKEIPSKRVERMSASLANAIRRLFATALLDPAHHNEWFVNLCERTIPLRSFPETYDYLTRSHHSFVSSFSPLQRYHDSFHGDPLFRQSELRKGELWMAIKRKHAVMVLDDFELYAKFKTDCGWMCAFDEQYFQTLLHLRDAAGIANRTVMYVDWNLEHTSSPRAFGKGSVNASMLTAIRALTEDGVGMQHDTGMDNATVKCGYNGVAGAKCFLFARKFWPDAVDVALPWFKEVALAQVVRLCAAAYKSEHLRF